MRTFKPPVWAGLFSAALLGLCGGLAGAAPVVDGTYAAVTPQNVELLTIRSIKGQVSGSYRVLHLNAAQPAGLDDEKTAFTASKVATLPAYALHEAPTMTLRFDSTFQRAVATAALGLSNVQTQSFARVNSEQAGLLIEMARYGGLFEICRLHRQDASCASMENRLADIVPFRPFPQPTADRPALASVMTARLDRSLALNP